MVHKSPQCVAAAHLLLLLLLCQVARLPTNPPQHTTSHGLNVQMLSARVDKSSANACPPIRKPECPSSSFVADVFASTHFIDGAAAVRSGEELIARRVSSRGASHAFKACEHAHNTHIASLSGTYHNCAARAQVVRLSSTLGGSMRPHVSIM